MGAARRFWSYLTATESYVSYGGVGGTRMDPLLTYTTIGREQERRRQMDDTRAKDLDETRRLCYMALLFLRTKKYELAGTLVNALLHHQQVDGERDVIIELVLDALAGDTEAQDWLRTQIDRATEVLDR